MARAGELVYETLQLVAEQLEPGVTMLELDRIADEHIASKGGYPDLEGLQGLPGRALHLAELDGRARDPERLPRAGGRPDLGRPRRHARRPRRRQRGHAPGRRDLGGRAAAPRGLPGRARGRDRAGAGPGTTSRTSPMPSRSSSRRPASRSSGASSATGSAAPTTRTRRSRTGALPGRGPVLQEGMTLAIEPMITAGRPEVYVHDDDWSISSVDESLAAHFEHTVAVTAEGPRILTKAGAALLR